MIPRRRLISFFAFTSSFICILAQQSTKYIDVIYFKDGSRVEGIIVYKVPNVRVSISRHNYLTETDSVYTYKLDLIDKIVKEPIGGKPTVKEGVSTTAGANTNKQSNLGGLINDTPFDAGFMQQPIDMQFRSTPQPEKVYKPEPTFSASPGMGIGKTGATDPSDPEGVYRKLRKYNHQWNMQISGLRGITDYQYTQGIGNITNNRFDFSLSLGYQFNPYVFTGLGVSYSLSLNKKESSLPLFINTKINFLDKKTTPYFSLKTGYSVKDAKGIYLSPGFGMTFYPKGNQSINIGLGYSFQKAKYKNWSSETNKRLSFNEDYHGIYFKLSYEINIISVK